MVHIEDIKNFDDEATWDLICSGRTKGVFQLESRLGSSWAKRAQPRSIEELADLVSIIRPGTLEAELDGKSMTKHYTVATNPPSTDGSTTTLRFSFRPVDLLSASANRFVWSSDSATALRTSATSRCCSLDAR